MPHTWIIDIDGTILKHNGHLVDDETILDEVINFFSRIPKEDAIILMSAREERHALDTLNFLKLNGVRYTHAVFNLPKGERILINDIKPSGLKTAFSLNINRDEGLGQISFDLKN